jgi:hypothetical protein
LAVPAHRPPVSGAAPWPRNHCKPRP